MTTDIDFVKPVPCDCCGARSWSPAFAERGIQLGRCAECGLYYVAPMPCQENRLSEIESGHFADGQLVATAQTHLKAEQLRRPEFQGYVDLVRVHVPEGKWLDIGCGTGTLIAEVQNAGIEIEGIELTAGRRALARRRTGVQIFDRPLELLELPTSSIAAITMINVFSHLVSPTATLAEIHRVLTDNGILLLKTGEIGPGVKKHHAFHWALGDHLYFLGPDTIERYATKVGFQVIRHDKQWYPEDAFAKDRFRMKGRSRLRNLVKSAILFTPGVYPSLRWFMVNKRQAGNPMYSATLVLRKTSAPTAHERHAA